MPDIFITSREKTKDVTLTTVLPQSGYSSRLRNAQTLATQVYEKGLQIIADAISEGEKLQAAQQLTATLIPSSTVNVMSHEEDRCFQCQESGYIA